jgi:hypothetical protein
MHTVGTRSERHVHTFVNQNPRGRASHRPYGAYNDPMQCTGFECCLPDLNQMHTGAGRYRHPVHQRILLVRASMHRPCDQANNREHRIVTLGFAFTDTNTLQGQAREVQGAPLRDLSKRSRLTGTMSM